MTLRLCNAGLDPEDCKELAYNMTACSASTSSSLLLILGRIGRVPLQIWHRPASITSILSRYCKCHPPPSLLSGMLAVLLTHYINEIVDHFDFPTGRKTRHNARFSALRDRRVSRQAEVDCICNRMACPVRHRPVLQIFLHSVAAVL